MEALPSVGELFENGNASSLGALLISACEAYCEATLPGEVTYDKVFCRAVSAVLGQASYKERAKFAEALVEINGLPQRIYLFMACDEFALAQHFLGEDYLHDIDDLLKVIENTTSSHRLALANRQDLPREAMFAIVSQGETDVIDNLSKLHGPQIYLYYDDNVLGSEQLAKRDDYEVEEVEEVEEVSAFEQMLTVYANSSKLKDVVDLMSREANLPKAAVRTLFLKREVEAFSFLCQSLGIGLEVYEALVKFRTKRLGQMERVTLQICEDYVNIDLIEATQATDRLREKIKLNPMAITEI